MHCTLNWIRVAQIQNRSQNKSNSYHCRKRTINLSQKKTTQIPVVKHKLKTCANYTWQVRSTKLKTKHFSQVCSGTGDNLKLPVSSWVIHTQVSLPNKSYSRKKDANLLQVSEVDTGGATPQSPIWARGDIALPSIVLWTLNSGGSGDDGGENQCAGPKV